MKHYFHSLTLLIVFALKTTAYAEVSHVIVYTNGITELGLIDSLSADSVYYFDFDEEKHNIIPLKKVYFIYNDFQKLFYISYSLRQRIELVEERGGRVYTKSGESYDFNTIQFDLKMDTPQVYLSNYDDPVKTLNFLDIKAISSHISMVENSIRKGFFTTSGIFLVGTGIEILMDTKNFTSHILDIFPGGKTYPAMNFAVPLSTIGWMVYDLGNDNKTQYFCPVKRDFEFQNDMFVFSLKIWAKNVWKNIANFGRKDSKTPEKTPKEENNSIIK